MIISMTYLAIYLHYMDINHFMPYLGAALYAIRRFESGFLDKREHFYSILVKVTLEPGNLYILTLGGD